MKQLLTETYARTKRMTGIEARNPKGFQKMLADRNAFQVYTKSLCEGLSAHDAEDFRLLAETTRVSLMENSMFQLNPYETLTLPILRVFYPKLIAKELVNVVPIDKPDVIKGFIHASFKRWEDSGYVHPFPSVSTDISRGPAVGITIGQLITTTQALNYNILAAIDSRLDATRSHIEKNFVITEIYDGTNYLDVEFRPTVDGTISETVQLTDGTIDVLSGHIDFLNGYLYLSTTQCGSGIESLRYKAVASLEENMINPYVKFEIEKIRLTVVDRRISAEWTINMEQDIKALFDLQLQSELVNIIGEQIALDIDREIIGGLLDANAASNPVSHTDTFNKYPPTSFTWGRKLWFENIIPKLNNLSAQVYNSCLMGAANTLACNPLDAAIFESLNGFEYTGNSVDGGDVGYKSATVSGGKWKILVSSIVPVGKVIMKYRSPDLARACYVYAPYVPALLMPYPLGENPSLTIMSRYATKVIRPNALAVLNIIDSVADRDTTPM